LYEAVKTEFLKGKNTFIPSNIENVFCSANDAMLLGSSELAELLTEKQMKLLFIPRHEPKIITNNDLFYSVENYLSTPPRQSACFSGRRL
jgi:hypothetical protein